MEEGRYVYPYLIRRLLLKFIFRSPQYFPHTLRFGDCGSVTFGKVLRFEIDYGNVPKFWWVFFGTHFLIRESLRTSLVTSSSATLSSPPLYFKILRWSFARCIWGGRNSPWVNMVRGRILTFNFFWDNRIDLAWNSWCHARDLVSRISPESIKDGEVSSVKFSLNNFGLTSSTLQADRWVRVIHQIEGSCVRRFPQYFPKEKSPKPVSPSRSWQGGGGNITR